MSDRSSDDLEDRMRELEAAVDELRRAAGGRRRPRLRPPSPGEALRFADEFAIPTALAVLEANVRTLELLRDAIRAADRDHDDAGGETLDRLDRAVSELGRAIEESSLPANPEARALLREARALNAEVRDRLAGSEDDDVVEIEVQEELDSIREELDEEE